MKERMFSAMLVLLILVAAIACGSSEQEITGQELIDGILASAENQATYRWEMNMGFTMSGTLEGEYGEMDYSMDNNGVVDMTAQEMQMDMTTTMNVRANTQSEETVIAKVYVIDDMAYIGIVSQVTSTEWVKGDASEDFWEQDSVSQIMELCYGAEAEILGTETVKGIDCYKAEISPGMDELLEFMRSRIEKEGLPAELTENSISSYSIKGWFAKDTFFPVKVHEELDLTLDIEGDEAIYHFILDGVFYDWNESVSIELPPEAEEAEYIGPMDM